MLKNHVAWLSKRRSKESHWAFYYNLVLVIQAGLLLFAAAALIATGFFKSDATFTAIARSETLRLTIPANMQLPKWGQPSVIKFPDPEFKKGAIELQCSEQIVSMNDTMKTATNFNIVADSINIDSYYRNNDRSTRQAITVYLEPGPAVGNVKCGSNDIILKPPLWLVFEPSNPDRSMNLPFLAEMQLGRPVQESSELGPDQSGILTEGSLYIEAKSWLGGSGQVGPENRLKTGDTLTFGRGCEDKQVRDNETYPLTSGFIRTFPSNAGSDSFLVVARTTAKEASVCFGHGGETATLAPSLWERVQATGAWWTAAIALSTLLWTLLGLTRVFIDRTEL